MNRPMVSRLAQSCAQAGHGEKASEVLGWIEDPYHRPEAWTDSLAAASAEAMGPLIRDFVRNEQLLSEVLNDQQPALLSIVDQLPADLLELVEDAAVLIPITIFDHNLRTKKQQLLAVLAVRHFEIGDEDHAR